MNRTDFFDAVAEGDRVCFHLHNGDVWHVVGVVKEGKEVRLIVQKKASSVRRVLAWNDIYAYGKIGVFNAETFELLDDFNHHMTKVVVKTQPEVILEPSLLV